MLLPMPPSTCAAPGLLSWSNPVSGPVTTGVSGVMVMGAAFRQLIGLRLSHRSIIPNNRSGLSGGSASRVGINRRILAERGLAGLGATRGIMAQPTDT